MKRIAVVLSGCGHKDGSEITEAVSVLISLSEAGANYKVFAPNLDFKVKDAITAEPTSASRNVLQESARISRGQIQEIGELKAKDFEGLVIPGGSGVALNLCDWGVCGAECSVHPEVKRVINEFYMAAKPIAAICIAPALVAAVLGSEGVTVTIGNDPTTAEQIRKTGAVHENCAVDDFVTDREHRVVTTPAYMHSDAKSHQVFVGIRKAVRELVEMA